MHSPIAVSSRTPSRVAPSRRPTSIAAAAVALVLVVAACTGSDPADPQGASSAGSADKPRSGVADLSVGPTFLGTDPASGDPSWAYPGSRSPAQLLACADALVGDDLACLEEDPAGASEPTSLVVLINAQSGQESGRFEVPARARRVAVTGPDVVVWSTSGLTTGDVAPYSTSGEPRWSVPLPARFGFNDRIVVGPTTTSLETTNQARNRELRRVLSLEDGSLLAERVGTASVRMLENGSVLRATLEGVGSGGELTLLDPDGAEVAELPGHEILPGIFSLLGFAEEPVGPILVHDGAGSVLELDPATGATTPTEIAVPRSMQPLTATKLGDAVLFSDYFSLRRIDPQAPDVSV